MIPPFDERGLLPPGQHECANIAELGSHFATNARRTILQDKFAEFINVELALVAPGLELYVGGSYLSDKPYPGDIDCTVCISLKNIPAYADLIRLAGDGGKNRIFKTYGVEFYLTISDMGRNDFRLFFSYAGEKTAQAKNIDAKDLRGIVKVIQWTPQ